MRHRVLAPTLDASPSAPLATPAGCRFRVRAWHFPEASAARQPRHVLRRHLGGLVTDPAVLDDCEAMVAELFANVYRHVGGGCELRVLHHDGVPVVCEVADTGHQAELVAERLRAAAYAGNGGLAEGGLGLRIVVRLSRGHCGAHAVRICGTGAMGTGVWFAVPPVGRPPLADADPTRRNMSVPTIDEQLLREALITELRKLDAVRTEPVADAFRAVSRLAFIPEATPEQAYEAENAVVTKRDAEGTALSSVSAARIQAFMLEQAQIEPGMRVLEIGSGGYNAALIAELVGPEGAVTTVDIDPDVIDRASRLLSAAGYRDVQAVTRDGAYGVPERGPYDRIVVTVEASDLASAWVSQLAEGGRIVVPLRLRGLTRSVAFVRTGDRLVSDEYELCGFVPMRGANADRMHLVVLHDASDEQVGLRFDGEPLVNPAALREAWTCPRVEAWSGVTMGRGLPYDDLELWLATTLPEFGLMAATREARDCGLVLSWSAGGISVALDVATGSFAYLAIRPVNAGRTLFEFGAAAHGPRARDTADRMIDRIRAWDREQRGAHAQFIAQPNGGPADLEVPAYASRVVERPSYRFTIVWPAR